MHLYIRANKIFFVPTLLYIYYRPPSLKTNSINVELMGEMYGIHIFKKKLLGITLLDILKADLFHTNV